MSESSKKLNKQQLQAIKHKKGPLLVIAGAGTGKTTVITERVKFLIEEGLAKPDEILALTFTEKSAREMEERIDIALPYGYTNMWILTFHSFCERILRREALQIGLDPRYKLMTIAETVQLIRQNLFKFKLNYFRPLGNPYKFIDGMLQHFSRLQDENINSLDYVKWARKLKPKTNEEKIEKEKYIELANAYRTYEEIKTGSGFMDFGDLITKTVKLFKDRPNVLKEYQRQFKYILIDEFQDTNYSQNRLAILLAKGNSSTRKTRSGPWNITVVGDDDQSIYRFRGAAISNIIQFKKNFPKAKVVTLTQNYRSGQEILDKAYDLIQHNNPDRLEVVEKVNKKLISDRKEIGEIEFIHTNRVEQEAEEVVKKIVELGKNYDYKDFAILIRANNHSEPFIRSLQRFGIPYQFLGPGRLFRQAEIIDLISYLKVLYNFDDNLSYYRIVTLSQFAINARDVAKLGNFAKKNNFSLFEASEKAGEINISEESKEKVSKLVEMIYRHLALAQRETAGQVLYYFLEETQLLKSLLDPKNSEAQKRASNISKFFDKLKTYEVGHNSGSVQEIVDYINLAMEVGESPLAADSDWGEINAVNILTIHSSKGLEFPVVFLINLVAQRFPTVERREQIPIPESLIKEILPQGDFHVQEERRLFYVGMTRAKDKLYLTAANYYGEGKREKKLSQFIQEALGKLLVNEELKKEIKQLSFSSYGIKGEEISENKKIDLKLDTLSYSQIETYLICPLHFKLRYIWGVPAQPIAAACFGISIHKTLSEFCDNAKTKKQNAKTLLKILQDNWISEGYESREHERESYKKAKKFMKDFYGSTLLTTGKPVLLEHSFIIEIERPSDPKQKIKIRGTIDRVDLHKDGTVEIIDYKTGDSQLNQKEADKNLQLTFYALAARMSNESIFKNAKEVKLTLYYLSSGEKITSIRTESQLIKAKEEIFKLKEQIEHSDFKCSDNFLCQNCEYKMLCQADLQ